MPPQLLLGPGEAHLWLFRYHGVDDPSLLAAFRDLLDDEERARMDRYMMERSRREFLATHALARSTLSRYAGVAPRNWRFRSNAYGRPEIANGGALPSLRFNLSNCDGLVACLVALDREIGVDVEDLERRGPNLGVADRYFAPLEVASLRALPEHAQRRRFFDYWTLKESYIKARGMGLAIPLHHFWFTVEPPPAPVRIAFDERLPDDPSSWQFDQLAPSERYLVATAIRRSPGPVGVDQVAILTRETVPLADD